MLGGTRQENQETQQGTRQGAPAASRFDVQIQRICQAVGVALPSHLEEYLEVTHQAISVAKKRNAIPKSWLAILNRKYGISIDWILSGCGPMKVSWGDKMFRPPDPPSPTVECAPTAPGQAHPPPDLQGIRISDALQATARVLESGTSYATALYLNIQHFDRAITAESRIADLEQMSAHQKISITDLEVLVASQKDQISKMQQTIDAMQDQFHKMIAQVEEWSRKPRDKIQRDDDELDLDDEESHIA